MVSVLLLTSFMPVPRVPSASALLVRMTLPVRMAAVKEPVYVYLCEGPASKVYHASPDCRGLSRCSTKIYKVTQEEAVKMGRRPCKIEYK